MKFFSDIKAHDHLVDSGSTPLKCALGPVLVNQLSFLLCNKIKLDCQLMLSFYQDKAESLRAEVKLLLANIAQIVSWLAVTMQAAEDKRRSDEAAAKRKGEEAERKAEADRQASTDKAEAQQKAEAERQAEADRKSAADQAAEDKAAADKAAADKAAADKAAADKAQQQAEQKRKAERESEEKQKAEREAAAEAEKHLEAGK